MRQRTPDVLFVGFNRYVAALDRKTGIVLWKWKAPRGSGFVALLPDGDRLFVSVHGYTYSLDARTGEPLWENEMKGFGMGIPSLATSRGATNNSGAAAQSSADAAAAAAGS
jgi:outer membrane protein assembly factor BamB